jgi:hypothetical protein
MNDLKYGVWDYRMVLTFNNRQDNLMFINGTSFKMLDLDYVNEKHPNILVGLGTVNVSKFRQPENVRDMNYAIPYVDGNEIIFYEQDTSI